MTALRGPNSGPPLPGLLSAPVPIFAARQDTARHELCNRFQEFVEKTLRGVIPSPFDKLRAGSARDLLLRRCVEKKQILQPGEIRRASG